MKNNTRRRYYWNGRQSVPMPQTSRLEQIVGTLLLAAVLAALGVAYAKVLTQHDAGARAAYSHR